MASNTISRVVGQHRVAIVCLPDESRKVVIRGPIHNAHANFTDSRLAFRVYNRLTNMRSISDYSSQWNPLSESFYDPKVGDVMRIGPDEVTILEIDRFKNKVKVQFTNGRQGWYSIGKLVIPGVKEDINGYSESMPVRVIFGSNKGYHGVIERVDLEDDSDDYLIRIEGKSVRLSQQEFIPE